jgi:hypothetical protein
VPSIDPELVSVILSTEQGIVLYGGGGSGLYVQRVIEAKYDDPAGVTVRVEIQLDDRGRPEVQEVRARRRQDIPGPEITNELLRAIPVARLVGIAVTQALYELRDGRLQPVNEPTRWAQEANRFHRGRPVDPEHLERVAHAYRAAVVSKRPPKQAIAEDFHVSTSTASRYIKAARDGGYLGKATPGVAGELEQEDSQ